jgi:dihydrofolate reductase
MHWGNLEYFKNEVIQKNHSTIHLHVKVIFGKKTYIPFPKYSKFGIHFDSNG